MKREGFQFQINQACVEQLEPKQGESKAFYCRSCAKEVVDFSLMSDREIIAYFQSVSGKVCGKFRNEQLNREVLVPMLETPKSNWSRIFAGFVFLGTLLKGQSGQAQTNKETQLEIKSGDLQTDAIRQMEVDSSQCMLVGRVLDFDSKVPIAFVNVQVMQSDIVCKTDSAGCFRMELPNDFEQSQLKVQVTLNGVYESNIVECSYPNENKALEILMVKRQEFYLKGDVAYSPIVTTKKRWFHR